jgi:hypothetical protein
MNELQATEAPPDIEHSGDLTELIKAMVAASANFTHPVRNAVNHHLTRKYATLNAVIDAYRPAYTAAGLVVTQIVLAGSIVTMVAHVSGQWLRFTTPMRPDKAGVQALGSAITYMRRYTLQTLVGIAADDDDDGNGAQNSGTSSQGYTATKAKANPAGTKEAVKLIKEATTIAELDALGPKLKAIKAKCSEDEIATFTKEYRAAKAALESEAAIAAKDAE